MQRKNGGLMVNGEEGYKIMIVGMKSSACILREGGDWKNSEVGFACPAVLLR